MLGYQKRREEEIGPRGPSGEDPEAPEEDYWEFSEGPSESEEVFEFVPCEANPSASTNLFIDQGKPRCIYTYLFWSRYFM
uniref:Uncharacterized protein n=1 Tax=Setaria viridis TaxID=4556 RepID=A0A4U6THH6_SETVI|nr:hypothetical protein SEVIR_8G097200v2 [Setaria viridis]